MPTAVIALLCRIPLLQIVRQFVSDVRCHPDIEDCVLDADLCFDQKSIIHPPPLICSNSYRKAAGIVRLNCLFGCFSVHPLFY